MLRAEFGKVLWRKREGYPRADASRDGEHHCGPVGASRDVGQKGSAERTRGTHCGDYDTGNRTDRPNRRLAN